MVLQVQPPYGSAPDYIAALAESAAPYLLQEYDHLLFSFHGVPERQIRKSDPTGRHCLSRTDCCEVSSPAHATCYRAQCFMTVRAVVAKANVPSGRFSVTFQSRLGRDPWLSPYTDQELPKLAVRGVRKLLVICPAFVSDCLETLEEIGMRGRDTFLGAGGKEFIQIPCLNEHPLWLSALENMVAQFRASTPPAAGGAAPKQAR
jgi:ferrochelatase